jgi:hypothetical protein
MPFWDLERMFIVLVSVVQAAGVPTSTAFVTLKRLPLDGQPMRTADFNQS